MRHRALGTLGTAGLLLLTLTLVRLRLQRPVGHQDARRRSPARLRPAARPARPVAGDQLVALEDDKKLQTADNIIPAVNAKAGDPAAARRAEQGVGGADTDEAGRRSTRQTTSTARPRRTSRRTSSTAEGLTDGAERRLREDRRAARPTSPRARPWPTSTPTCSTRPASTPASRTVGSRELYSQALEKGEIQVVPGVRRHADRVPQQGRERRRRRAVASPATSTPP